jgi:hypothetical protein
MTITDLAYLGYRALQIMEESDEWSSETVSRLDAISAELGLSTTDEESFFVACEEILGLPEARADWQVDGNNVGLIYENDVTHTFSGFIEVGDPMDTEEDRVLKPDPDMRLTVTFPVTGARVLL